MSYMSNMRIEGKGPLHEIKNYEPESRLGHLAKKIGAITAPIVFCLGTIKNGTRTTLRATLKTTSSLPSFKPKKP